MNLEQFYKDNKEGISQASIRTYKGNVERIFKAVKPRLKALKTLRFLYLDYLKVIEWINSHFTNSLSKSGYLTTAYLTLEMLKPTKKIKDAITAYRTADKPLKEKYQDRINSNTPTEKQKKNYISYDKLLKYADELEKPISKAVALISLIYPRRTDLKDVKIITLTDFKRLNKEGKEKNNWLVISKNGNYTFYFYQFKTCKLYTQCVIKVDNPKVKKAIKEYLKVRNNDPNKPYFIYSQRGIKLTDKTYSRYISNIFKPLGVNITPNSIRHIFISQNIDQHKADQAKAANMSHSVASQKSYILDYEADPINN